MALHGLQVIKMSILSGLSTEEKGNGIGQSSMGFMRRLFQNNVRNRTESTVKNFMIFNYILLRKIVEGK